MHRPRNLLLAALAAALAVNLAIGYRVYAKEAERTGENEAFEKISLMMRVLYLIRKDYVDPEKTGYDKLVHSALHGMVRSLDPFSDFMTPDQYDSMMETTDGEFGGLGIIVSAKDGILTIVSPIDGTPGSRAGLQAGDQIIRIDGEPTADLKLNDAVLKLRGPPGTKVTITIHRPGNGETKDHTLERAKIPVYSVKDARILPETRMGYVRITQFSEPTAEELQKSIAQLETAGMEALIMDLRNNPGGLLPSAVEICSFFLEPETLIVSTEGRQASQKHEFLTRKKGFRFQPRPTAILINGGSASAAEIVAGCLQDWGRAILIGERSFGKGSVQNVVPLPDGSALRLTTAMYYTPSRRVIHEHGVEPDIAVPLSKEQYRAIFEAQDGFGPVGAAGVEDPQLQRAVEVLRSYDVYLKATQGKFRQLRTAGSKGAAAAAPPEAPTTEEEKP